MVFFAILSAIFSTMANHALKNELQSDKKSSFFGYKVKRWTTSLVRIPEICFFLCGECPTPSH